MNDIRPFEEYKEMIQDMSKEEMIKGLYNLSARITEQDKEIERLHSIIKEAKEFIYENAYDTERENCIDDLWGEIPKLLEILDKGVDKE